MNIKQKNIVQRFMKRYPIASFIISVLALLTLIVPGVLMLRAWWKLWGAMFSSKKTAHKKIQHTFEPKKLTADELFDNQQQRNGVSLKGELAAQIGYYDQEQSLPYVEIYLKPKSASTQDLAAFRKMKAKAIGKLLGPYYIRIYLNYFSVAPLGVKLFVTAPRNIKRQLRRNPNKFIDSEMRRLNLDFSYIESEEQVFVDAINEAIKKHNAQERKFLRIPELTIAKYRRDLATCDVIKGIDSERCQRALCSPS